KAPSEILAMHFGDYKLQILDRAYHRLKTTDHVSHFRPAILQRIDTWLAEPQWLSAAGADEVRRGRYGSQDEAEAALLEQLTFIRNHYEQMDDLLDEIDRRNASYAKASLEQVRYLLSGSQDAAGQLAALLQFLAGQMEAGILTPDVPWPEQWATLFALDALQTIEPASLFTPRSERRNHSPQPLAVTSLTAAEREEARRRLRQRLATQLTYRSIDDYVQARLGQRQEIRARDLGIESTADFIRLIYVAAYGRSRHVGFRTDLDGERVESAGGKFNFKDIRIRRK
ncbi:MAG: Wadjet anti-phage system protein JetA family protein, partial [Mycobacterium leprae]